MSFSPGQMVYARSDAKTVNIRLGAGDTFGVAAAVPGGSYLGKVRRVLSGTIAGKPAKWIELAYDKPRYVAEGNLQNPENPKSLVENIAANDQNTATLLANILAVAERAKQEGRQLPADMVKRINEINNNLLSREKKFNKLANDGLATLAPKQDAGFVDKVYNWLFGSSVNGLGYLSVILAAGRAAVPWIIANAPAILKWSAITYAASKIYDYFTADDLKQSNIDLAKAKKTLEEARKYTPPELDDKLNQLEKDIEKNNNQTGQKEQKTVLGTIETVALYGAVGLVAYSILKK
jgi:hypothetical protein